MEVLIREFWEFLVVAAGVIIYAIRLEGKLNVFGVEIDAVKRQREEDKQDAAKSREEVHKMLRDISDKLDRVIERSISK